jgi:hypothetical protein
MIYMICHTGANITNILQPKMTTGGKLKQRYALYLKTSKADELTYLYIVNGQLQSAVWFKGSMTFVREAFGREAFGLEAFSLEAFGLEAFGLEAFGLEAFGLEAFGLEAFGLEAFLPRGIFVCREAFVPRGIWLRGIWLDGMLPKGIGPRGIG